MKKFSSSGQMFSENLKKYLRRAGIVVATVSIGAGTTIAFATDETRLYSEAKVVAVSQLGATSIEDTKVEYAKIEYTDLQETVEEAELAAKVEKADKAAEAVALASRESTIQIITTVEDQTEATAEEPTEEATEGTEEITTEEEDDDDTVVLATESGKKSSKKSKKSSGDEKQQLGIEVTESTESAEADAIYVDESEYASGTYLGTYTATAYCGCSKCCGKSNGVTASGTKATAGRTIAAPSSFSFGTELVIDGHTYVVEDRGGSIKGKRIDIYFSSHSEALNFGRRSVEVYVK